MANIIPPLVSDSPPPPPSEEDEDDEYDDFRGSNDISYGCDSFSLTPSPEESPKKVPKETSSSIEQESEFKFLPVTPVSIETTIENLHVETININGSNGKDSQDRDDKISKQKIENFENNIEDIPNNVFHKNNLHTDNIPFIIENENLNQENDKKICDNIDNINGKITEALTEFHIEDRNITVKEINLSNGFPESKTPEELDSIRKNSISDYCINESNADELSLSKANNDYNLDTCENNDKHNEEDFSDFSDFSKNVNCELSDDFLFPNSIKTETTSNKDEDNENFNKTDEFQSSDMKHSTKNNSDLDLVKGDSLENLPNNIIELQKHGVDSELHSIIPDFNDEDNMSPTTQISVTNECKDTDFDNFGTFISHSKDSENKYSDLSHISKTVDNNLGKNLDEIHSTEFSNDVLNKQNLEVEDDFGNFSSFPINSFVNQDPHSNVQKNNIVHESQNDKDEGGEDDFASFASFSTDQNTKSSDNIVLDNFTSFTVDSTQIGTATEEDFGEFTSTTIGPPSIELTSSIEKTETSKSFLELDEKKAFEKTEEIVKDIFTPSEEVFDDFQYFELGKDDFIFKQLQDVTDTPALGYHWSKSSSQKLLLKALNIDSRNILYGHSWNSSVPRFAANLGLQPLEPVKMEPLTPTSFEPTPITAQSSQSEPADVPRAQFDWTGSGLVNPLDYCQTTLLDLEQLVASLDIPNANPASQQSSCSTAKVDEDWDIWLQYTPSNSAIQSSKLEPPLPSQPDTDDYEEFTSFQTLDPPQVPTAWPNVPLRETHISDVPQAHIDVDVCLQPTIVTPEMPRKLLNTEDDTVISETLVDDKGSDLTKNDDIEFDDFQMVHPVDVKNNLVVEEEDLKKTNLITAENNSQNLEIPSIPVLNTKVKTTEPNTSTENDEDDDFTEFHSSKPISELQPQIQPSPPAPMLAPILQPLQPTQIYTTPSSTEINWPDPGITQDELKRFEEVFSVPLDQKKQSHVESIVLERVTAQPKATDVKEYKPVQSRSDIPVWESASKSNSVKNPVTKEEPKKVVPKQNSIEDEEWSDFISVPKPSPVHKTKVIDRTQTSSPDLPLSVLNLGNIQPTKQPIPVITPQGLVQTKLSTNMNHVIQPKVVNTRSYDLPPLQPSIISNQYASQAYSFGTGNNAKSSKILQNGQDDDEWGEFVSSPLPPQYQNSSTTMGHHSWNNFVPNIHVNPGHATSQGFYTNQISGRSVNSNDQKKSSNLSGLVLPDLDFLSLKDRSGVPRKK